MKTVWEKQDEQGMKDIMAFGEDYRQFLSRAKTEREFVHEAKKLMEEAGFQNLNLINRPLKAGDRVYTSNRGKNICLFVIGEEPLTEGMNVLGAHIDSPRLDLKQHPLYESDGLALFDTHYYGGIKKYQWTTIPLAIHGVVAKKDGSVVKVNVGEDASDPVFCVSDLLIHLSKDQMSKNLADAIEGENLDVLVGSRPLAEDKKKGDTDGGKKETKDLVKQQVLNILKDKYGMEEEDFLSAELEIVPAGPARDLGLDRSMVAAYGQDDRVCAFTSLDAILRSENPEYTSCCLLTDKEEIGSVGATGAHSHFFENATAELMDRCGQYSELKLRRCLSACRMLSSDVSAAYDPLYGSAYEKKNSAYFGKGIVYNKYTGARGKSGSNDANAEYFGWVRKVMDDADVAFQTAELGKVDVGGGGTIAYISAAYAMNVVDAGVAVLNMHAPMEVTSKADIFEARNAYMAFLKA